MTDVRAIIEEQCRIRRLRGRFQTGLALVCIAMFPLVALSNHAHGKPFIDGLGLFFPLLFVGTAGAFYSARHIQALRDAIADPDPSLDAHFAEALAMQREEVAAVGRRAFVERFAHRLPDLDEAGWASVAQALPKATADEATRLLGMIDKGAMVSAIEPVERFAQTTKSDRLRTAARQTLGDLRLRLAREKVLATTGSIQNGQEREAERLGLQRSGTL